MRRGSVSICALGAVTPAGTGLPALAAALGQRDWRPVLGIERPDAPPLPAATCPDFTTQGVIPPLVARRFDRPTRLLAVAAREALAALPDPRPWADDRLGVCAGTWTAGTDALVQVLRAVLLTGPEEAPPMQFPSTVANAPASQLGILERMAGPNLTFYEKQVGGLRAIVEAARLLNHDRADGVIAAGVDEAQWLNAESYDRLGALASASRPGFTLGEGAAVLLLSREAVVPPLAHVVGWGAASSPTTTYLYPDSPAALVRACRQAMERADLSPSDIDLVLSLANGAPVLDHLEARALDELFPRQRPAALAVTERLGEGAYAAALRPLLATLLLSGSTFPAWPPPKHLVPLGFAAPTRPVRTALVTAVAGGGAVIAAVLSAP